MHGERRDEGAAPRGRTEAERGLDRVAVVAGDGDGEPVERLRERPPRDSRVRGGDDVARVAGGGLRSEAPEERGQEPGLLLVEARARAAGRRSSARRCSAP